jgi:hypothetical protein
MLRNKVLALDSSRCTSSTHRSFVRVHLYDLASQVRDVSPLNHHAFSTRVDLDDRDGGIEAFSGHHRLRACHLLVPCQSPQQSRNEPAMRGNKDMQRRRLSLSGRRERRFQVEGLKNRLVPPPHRPICELVCRFDGIVVRNPPRVSQFSALQFSK